MQLPNNITIGIIGGGQLGKMLIEASRPWNIQNVVLENDPNCPASLVANKVIVGSITDENAIRQLAAECDIITYEIEHIHVEALIKLQKEGKKIIPNPEVLKIISNKGVQKNFYKSHQLDQPPFIIIDNAEWENSIIETFKGEKIVYKTCTGGYDGKGVSIFNKNELIAKKNEIVYPCIFEQFYEDITEFAVIVAKDVNGNTSTFPLVEMYFHPISNLVEFLFSPANIGDDLEIQCRAMACKAVNALNSPGLFAVELFVRKNGEVLINEIAPRPHNSGHHTIEGCITSQFEQLNRILLGFPLGNTEMLTHAAMINLTGALNVEGEYALKNTNQILDIPGVYIHLYNKKESKAHRKLGHVTVLAKTHEALISKANTIKNLIEFEAKSKL